MLTTPIRELDHRSGDGIEVRLLWNSYTNRVSVTVEDERSGELFMLEVPSAEAREAFNHPYGYMFRQKPARALAA